MLETLRLFFQENWQWRKRIFDLALTDIRKTVRGTALGWIWLFVKPAMYVTVFWFALEIGLRAEKSVGDYPYILWLVSGLIPWFFMQNMLNAGANVYKRYSFLVNKIHFPLSVIPTFYSLSQFIINAMLISIVVIACFVFQIDLSIHAIQLPFIYLLMWLFWDIFSVLASPLSAISKDFNNLLKAFSTPIFWMSGIIFNIYALGIPIAERVLAFNPVSFFATSCRAALCEQYWVWEKPELLIPFVIVFALTAITALVCHHRLRRDISDVL